MFQLYQRVKIIWGTYAGCEGEICGVPNTYGLDKYLVVFKGGLSHTYKASQLQGV